jgi:phosphate:Na+ symporter
MGDVVEEMLRKAMTALTTNDRKLTAEASRMDNVVDWLDEAIKLYVTKLTRESVDESDGRRATEIIAFAINLEHIGDIIDKNLIELANKKIKHKYEFSKDGAAELEAFYKRIIENLQLAFSVFMNGNVRIARTLIEEKTQLRNLELSYAESHLARLREGRPESIETSSLHLDVLRDLKRIHSHICSAAYPVLEAAGELQPNRLKETDVGITREQPPDALPAPNHVSGAEFRKIPARSQPSSQGRHLVAMGLILRGLAKVGVSPAHEHVIALDSRHHADALLGAAPHRHFHTEFDSRSIFALAQSGSLATYRSIIA